MLLILLILFGVLVGDGDITITDPWMRPGAEKMATALYFTIENNGKDADTLYAVSTDISMIVQLHETY